MRIYLDEDIASSLLTTLLEKAGHDVASPITAGILGRSDAVQLTHAVREQRVCLSRNYEDFEELHLLLQQSQGHHPGMIIVRRENDPTRDLTAKGVVAALRNLEAAQLTLEDEYVILNQWR